jgi:FlaA1/EpsC-like NDP-sugar epimerase
LKLRHKTKIFKLCYRKWGAAVALRIKSQWYKEDTERSLGEIAGALAFNAWKLAMDRAITLHGESFIYTSDRQRLNVIAEYLIFQIQMVDRMVHQSLEQEDRQKLITSLAQRLSEHMQENSCELLGAGDYGDQFITLLNRRSMEYSELGFGDDGPSYPFMRHLGYEIQQLMGTSQENRWVIDQVMDMDAPEIYKQMKRTLRNLFM